MKKIVLTTLLFLMLSISVFSASELTLQINEQGSIQAVHVLDNDNDIEFVDVFVVTDAETETYSFENVKQNDVLNVPLQEGQEAFYNFMDDEGSQKGIGSNIPIYGELPSTPNLVVIENAGIEAEVINDENALYKLQITADVNAMHSLENISFEYSLGKSLLVYSQELTGGPNIYTGIISPFTGKTVIISKIKALDSEGKEYSYDLGKRIFNLMALNPFCSDQNQSIEFKKATETESSESKKIFFAEPENSWIHLIYMGDQQNIYVSKIIDDDGGIQWLDVFYDNGETIVHREFENIRELQPLGLIVPMDKDAYYSFSDNDGTMTGTGGPILITRLSFCEQFPQNPNCEMPDLIKSAELTARLDEENLEYYLDAEVEIFSGQETEINEVRFYYNSNFISLQKQSSKKWKGSIGPFDDETSIESYAVAYNNSKGWTDRENLPPRWDKLLAGLFECREICFDNIDNDGDGFIDEGCALIPQLYARVTSLPKTILIGTYFDLNYEIANSGGSDANGFSFKTYFDQNKLIDQKINSLASNEAIEYFHNLYSGTEAGEKYLNIQVDYLGEIIESLEADNNLTLTVKIRLNEIDVNYNYNESIFLGDVREIKLRDLFGKNISDADIEITYPSGRKIELISDEEGIIKFNLLEGGTHLLKAAKESFEDFEGSFEVETVEVQYKKELQKGEWQEFTVKTEEGKPVAGAEVNVILPNGNTEKFITDMEGKIAFLVKQNGTYAFLIKRKEAAFFTSSFNALQTLEEAVKLISSNLLSLAGETVSDWIMFLLLLILCGFSAIKTFNNLKKHRENLPQTKRKQHMVLHSITAGIIFMIPLIGKWIAKSFAAGYAIALIELCVLFLIDYIKRQKEKTKIIKVK
ncbi:MAG: CARDB domain-containing protein [Candidatus Diapherotrites archaeon]